MKKLSLASWIFIALIAGIIAGIALMGNPKIATEYIRPWGTLFLNLVKFIVVPIVFFSIASGVISMKDIHKVASVGTKAIIYYIMTTFIAISIGLVFSEIFKGMYSPLSTTDLVYKAKEAPSIIHTVLAMFPANVIEPLLKANMLQIIFFSLLFGFGVVMIKEKGEAAAKVVISINEVFMKMMEIILKLSPVGVFCLITPVVATNGPSVLASLAAVLAVAYICFMVHMVFVYSLSVKVLGKMSPLTFFKGMSPAMIFAFSSASSMATLPLNISCAEEIGADKDITSFVLPLGATINMDGTAIYQGVCSVFIATCYGLDLTFMQMITIALSATLASIGTAGVPGAGMLMLAMVLQSVGLPVEGIALVAGVDRIFDMGRTTVNITGDAACAVVVSALEGKLSK